MNITLNLMNKDILDLELQASQYPVLNSEPYYLLGEGKEGFMTLLEALVRKWNANIAIQGLNFVRW